MFIKEAIAAIKEHHPDTLLLDAIMPHMNGLGALTAIRSNPDTKELLVLILSYLDQPADMARTQDLEAHTYLIKANLSLKRTQRSHQQCHD